MLPPRVSWDSESRCHLQSADDRRASPVWCAKEDDLLFGFVVNPVDCRSVRAVLHGRPFGRAGQRMPIYKIILVSVPFNPSLIDTTFNVPSVLCTHNSRLSVPPNSTLCTLPVTPNWDSESLPVVNTSYRSVVTCRYSENWLIVLADKLEISTGLGYCKEHTRATGDGYAGQRIMKTASATRTHYLRATITRF